ncbi:YfiR family protein [Pelagicoccus sp. SDUM812002]|uniref:YfiR family protein n=1 Tax=Pelagicoccus sp. SDUM812002 TaxID=3041266 RepID=UPI00280C5BC8|nr:YfiR family protein [Pelagicoccus sp. SDUM812002]MDQ8184073.1 YfiR family protein [Pelagicoccus sp. SDUM812002]
MPHAIHKFLTAFAAFLLVLLAGRASLQGQTLQIDSSTANWIEGFVDFVRWDGEENAEFITVGIIDAPEVESYLRKRASERTGKPSILVQAITATDSFDGVDIVFVGGSNRKHWQRIFSKCKDNNTLTIGTDDGFVENGGCVEFVVRRNRLRFYIEGDHVRESGVVISSKLLELAIEPKSR